jgi:MFS superfamily sulfate permease-like transporter
MVILPQSPYALIQCSIFFYISINSHNQVGYFCLMAGVGLCVSENMTGFSDWAYLLDPNKLKLAAPGLISGLLLTLIGRFVKNDAALPCIMVLIPGAFYIALLLFNISMEEARESGWIGAVSPSVPVTDLFTLVDISIVRWDCIFDILPTWVGMVFVVSFASCLDVAAISMDMGEALDTNKELMTVGAGNGN